MFIAAWNLQLCNVHACLKQREALGVSLKVIARIEYNAIGVKSIRFFLEIVLSAFGQPTCCFLGSSPAFRVCVCRSESWTSCQENNLLAHHQQVDQGHYFIVYTIALNCPSFIT